MWNWKKERPRTKKFIKEKNSNKKSQDDARRTINPRHATPNKKEHYK